MEVLRTKFKNEIVAEFVVPKKITNKVVIVACGMPSYPAKQKYNDLFEYFTRRGFWVFVPRYRGSWESGGLMFKKSPAEDILDIMDSLQLGFKNIWDGKEFVIQDPEFILLGSSFGGPAVLLNSKDKRVKKVIAFSPVLDWTTQDQTIESLQKMESFVTDAFGNGYRIVKKGWQKLETGSFYNPISELNRIEGSKCMLVQSKDDEIVLASTAKDFSQKARTSLFLVSRGGHLSISLLENKFKNRCLKFLGLR